MPAEATPCSERYRSMTSFALERSGVVLTAADLQASLGGKDVGVLDNVIIGPVKDAPAPLALAVRLQKASTSPQGFTTEFKGGVAFPWQPRAVQGKTSACLSYHVLLPADFEFHRGGALPGMVGAEGDERGDGFLVRLAWRYKGGGVTLRTTENGVTRAEPAERQAFELPRGRWVKLEQEVVVNTPKGSDGVLRVWVDGALAIQRTDMAYRAKPEVTIAGVSVDLFRGTGPDDSQAAASKDARVWLTPFEVRWPSSQQRRTSASSLASTAMPSRSAFSRNARRRAPGRRAPPSPSIMAASAAMRSAKASAPAKASGSMATRSWPTPGGAPCASKNELASKPNLAPVSATASTSTIRASAAPLAPPIG